MKSPILIYISAACFFPALVFPLAAQDQPKNDELSEYYVFNLGAPGGGTIAMASSINNIGWVAGDVYQTGNTTEHAELWVGSPFDLGTLGGPNSAVAWPNKNVKGEVAGIAETGEANPFKEYWSCALANFPTITNQVCLGFAWQDGVMSPLPPLPGGLDSYAAAVNNQGQIAGWAEDGVHDSTCNLPQVLQFEAVVWGPKLGQLTQLRPLPPDPDSAATAINDKGQVVGISGLCSNAVGGASAEHAVLWENGVPMNLGNFDGGMAWNTPTALNNLGQIVGFGNQADTPSGDFNPIAFLWTKEHHLQKIHPVGGDANNIAWGIDEQEQVVGDSCVDSALSNCRAFLWQNGVSTDLNTLIQSDSSLNLVLANDINDQGEIVGYAVDSTSGATVAFLAVPVLNGRGSSSKALQTQNDSKSRSFSVPENIRQELLRRVGVVIPGKN
jgi:probable HAF family extracellular repeat protein